MASSKVLSCDSRRSKSLKDAAAVSLWALHVMVLRRLSARSLLAATPSYVVVNRVSSESSSSDVVTVVSFSLNGVSSVEAPGSGSVASNESVAALRVSCWLWMS